jgi:glutamate N-acetyltransferase/amino-acid N-acetyltransferase
LREIEGGITAARGVQAAGVWCGIKKGEGPDLALILSEKEAAVAGVFTRNQVKAAPVLLCQEKIGGGKFSALVANSGNANACNGRRGMEDAVRMARTAAEVLGRPEEQVFVASTGVIGEPLPMEKICRGISMAAGCLGRDQGQQAARAIMTTDTFPKEAALSIPMGKGAVNLGGMAKGAGMIHPRMATMLAFISSDADISAGLLARCLKEAVRQSFNRITVDGDTSTNDMVLLFSNGLSGCPHIRAGSREHRAFQEGLNWVTARLARMIVQDGEGATKLITVKVVGARSDGEAEKAAFAVANSLLVKTAFFGQDCNWGRIVCALGRSGASMNLEELDLFLGPIQVVRKGVGLGADRNPSVRELLRRKEIPVSIHLNRGRGQCEVWTCDLSYEYVRINAAYRT